MYEILLCNFRTNPIPHVSDDTQRIVASFYETNPTWRSFSVTNVLV